MKLTAIFILFLPLFCGAVSVERLPTSGAAGIYSLYWGHANFQADNPSTSVQLSRFLDQTRIGYGWFFNYNLGENFRVEINDFTLKESKVIVDNTGKSLFGGTCAAEKMDFSAEPETLCLQFLKKIPNGNTLFGGIGLSRIIINGTYQAMLSSDPDYYYMNLESKTILPYLAGGFERKMGNETSIRVEVGRFLGKTDVNFSAGDFVGGYFGANANACQTEATMKNIDGVKFDYGGFYIKFGFSFRIQGL